MTYDKHTDEFVEMDFTEEVPGMDDTTFWQLCYLVAMLRSKKIQRPRRTRTHRVGRGPRSQKI
jgi:hypothetical protein